MIETDEIAAVRQLAEKLRMRVATLEDLRQAAPAFDLVPYAEAVRRGCVAVRWGDSAPCVVLGDPYDLDSQDWVESRMPAAFSYRVAHKVDITVYLSEREQGFRAMDGVAIESQKNISAEKTEEISFEKAAEEDSPVVKLVTSTLYDEVSLTISANHQCRARSTLPQMRLRMSPAGFTKPGNRLSQALDKIGASAKAECFGSARCVERAARLAIRLYRVPHDIAGIAGLARDQVDEVAYADLAA